MKTCFANPVDWRSTPSIRVFLLHIFFYESRVPGSSVFGMWFNLIFRGTILAKSLRHTSLFLDINFCCLATLVLD